MTKQDLQHKILNQPYNYEDWKDVLKRVFGATKLHQIPQPISITANDIAESASELGSFYTKDEMLVGIYQIIIKEDTTTDITKSKVGLRNLLRNVYKYDVDGALIVFVQGNKWRFSYVSEIRNRDGEIVTEPKRYTYLFGENEVCRTAADRFSKLIDKKYYLQDLYDAFSVEKLTKEFFSKYIEFYKKGVKHIIDNKEYYNILIDNKETDEDKRQKPIRDFVKKLLGRIVFLHFLQKKEWLGCPVYKSKKENDEIWIEGSKTFILDLFKQFPEKDNFHSQCLSVLFFETLNEKRANNIFPLAFNKQQVRIPYLNGGLFDTDFKDPKTNLPLEKLIDFPVDFFQSLLDFFEQYNFTIDENDPYETEVGIDPEMLGHIFENLLEDNRERGAFYTPKEIVHYMCQESLIEYLKTNATALKKQNDDETISAIENLVRNNRIDEAFTIKETAKHLDTLLKNVKVCDPAIGSGAFPMGMLKEIFECRRVLYPYLKTNEDFSPSQLKKEIIQGNIYGVDVENGAVEIARLRFWLALVVDELIPEPLPNLDYKIMQGNSLLERYDLVDLKFEKKAFQIQEVKEVDLFGNIINPQVSIAEFLQTKEATQEFNITELEEKYFYSTNAIEKQEIRNKLQTFEKEFINDQLKKELKDLSIQQVKKRNEIDLLLAASKSETDKQKIFSSKKYKDLTKLNYDIENVIRLKENLKEIKPSQKPYFLWHLYFMDVFDKGGFDIVIGNPPYIQLQKMGADGLALEKANYETFTKTGDIYCLFYEQGYNVLKNNGFLTYITSNKWMRAGYGESTRKFFAEKTNPISLIDFAGQKIFETATVDTNILIFKKSKNVDYTKSCVVKQKWDESLLKYINENSTLNHFNTSDSWIVLNPIEKGIKEKIEKIGTPLKDWGTNINYGIKTGYNEAFIIDEKTKKELVAEDPKSVDIIRPILRGRDIKKYCYEFADLWLINAHNGIKEKGINPIDINDYPAIKKHLDNYYSLLEKRTDKGDTPYNLRNCAYIEDFYRQKIIYPNMTKFLPFVYDDKGFLTNQKCFIITGQNIAYLSAFLNSSLFKYCFKDNFPELLGGTRELSKIFFDKIPIAKVDNKTNIMFEKLVNEIQSLKLEKKSTTDLEIKIDEILFDIYQLDERERAEIGFIEIK